MCACVHLRKLCHLHCASNSLLGAPANLMFRDILIEEYNEDHLSLVNCECCPASLLIVRLKLYNKALPQKKLHISSLKQYLPFHVHIQANRSSLQSHQSSKENILRLRFFLQFLHLGKIYYNIPVQCELHITHTRQQHHP